MNKYPLKREYRETLTTQECWKKMEYLHNNYIHLFKHFAGEVRRLKDNILYLDNENKKQQEHIFTLQERLCEYYYDFEIPQEDTVMENIVKMDLFEEDLKSSETLVEETEWLREF